MERFEWTPEFWREWVDSDRPARIDAIAEITRVAIEAAAIEPDDSVLNAGCGFGREAMLLSSRMSGSKGKLTLVDRSQEMVDAASEALSGSSISVKAQTADIENLPFDDDTFDLVFCIGVVMHTPDSDRAVSELLRVLKPGGRAVISFNNSLNPFTPIVRLWMKRKRNQVSGYIQNFQTPRRFARVCRSAGVSSVRIQKTTVSIGLGPGWLAPLWRAINFIGPAAISYEPVTIVKK